MIYQIRIGETHYFREFTDKRLATAWATEQADIEVRPATPAAMLAHFQPDSSDPDIIGPGDTAVADDENAEPKQPASVRSINRRQVSGQQ